MALNGMDRVRMAEDQWERDKVDWPHCPAAVVLDRSLMDDINQREAEAICGGLPCPYCRAETGENCVMAGRPVAPYWWHHPERAAAFYDQRLRMAARV